MRRDQQASGPFDILGIGLALADELIHGTMVVRVDRVVLAGDRAGGACVRVHERPSDVGQDPRGQAPHLGDPDVLGKGRVRCHVPDSLGDVRDRVADPFELVGDVVERQEVSQVARDRRLGRDRANDVVERLGLHRVDLDVTLDHGQRQRRVVRLERLDGHADALLDETRHPEERLLDEPFLVVQRSARRVCQ